MARLEFLDFLIRGQRRRHADKRKVVMNGFQVYVAADVRVCQQSCEFGAKDEVAVYFGIQQGLLAHAIARQKERFCALVPNRKREHPAQIFRTFGSILVVGVDNRFGIAAGMELVTQIFQSLAQLLIVVNLSVEYDPGGPVLIVDWLLAGFQIDD